MSTNSRPIGAVATLHGKPHKWNGKTWVPVTQNRGGQRSAARSQRTSTGPIGKEPLDALQRLLGPLGHKAAQLQQQFRAATDRIPGVQQAENLVNRGLAADDRLPSSRVAQGAGIVAQQAAQAAGLDPRLAIPAALLLTGRVSAGSGDDVVRRAQRAEQRFKANPPNRPEFVNPADVRSGDRVVAIPPSARTNRAPADALDKARASAANPPAQTRLRTTEPSGNRFPIAEDRPERILPIPGLYQPRTRPTFNDNGEIGIPIQTTPIEPGMRRAGPPSRDLGELKPRGPRGANRGIPDAEYQRMRRESHNAKQQKRLNRARTRLELQGVPGPRRRASGGASGEKASRFESQYHNGFADKPIGGRPLTAAERKRLRDFEQYDQRRWATEHDPISGQRRGTASAFPSKAGKDVRDPNYRDANLADSLGSADDYAGDRFGDTGGFGSTANRGWHNQNIDITNEAVGGRGQVGPLKGSLNSKRSRQGKSKLGKSQEAEAVNTLIDEYRFPEQFNQLEARDNGFSELPPRTGAVDPRRPQLGPRNKPVKDTKRRDNIPGGRRIEQSEPERARRAQERGKVARARAAANDVRLDDGGVNWKRPATTTQRSLPVTPERAGRVSQAADEQLLRRIGEHTLNNEYSILTPDAAERFRQRATARMGDRVLPPTVTVRGQAVVDEAGRVRYGYGSDKPGSFTIESGLGADPRRNRIDPNSVTVKGKAKDVDRARQQALGLEPEPDKNRGGSKGNTTDWERPDVRRRASGLKGGPAAQERADRRERGRTETPNINRNAGQQRLPDLIAQIQRNPKLTNAQKAAAIAELTKGINRGQRGTPSRGASRPGDKSVGPAPGKARSVKRTPARVTADQANDAALEAQKAGDQFNEFNAKGELRGVEAVGSTVRRGINETKISGRDPAAGGRTTEAARRMDENKARRATARGERLRTTKSGAPNKTDVRSMAAAQAALEMEAKEMERIRAARARRRRGG